MDHLKFYIDGEWVAPVTPRPHPVENPATGEEIATISLGSAADVDKAVAAATRAFESWSMTPVAERRALVEKFLEVYDRRFEEMAQTITAELGAPITMSREQQADTGSGHTRGFLDALVEVIWEEKLTNGDTLSREPIGVVGLITPWNWPMNQIALKVIPALLTGCTCVLKPSENTPLNALLWAEMMDEAGFPPGVFNLVNGDGPEVGSALSKHPDIAMMSFTGSTRAGTAVTIDAAPTVKRVTLELGGKSPNIIFADCDLEDRVAGGVFEVMNNTGQSCNAPSRMIVEASAYDQTVETAAEVANKVEVGPASEEGRHIGPVVNEAQWGKIQDLIQKGIDEGARLVAGGTGRPEHLNRGFYVKPTVFADVTSDMTIAREEIFGPVLAIMKFEDEDQAVEMANDTVYGLTNYVQSSDGARRNRLAAKLRSGMVEMNGESRGAGSPFGGMKRSGNGREGGVWGIEDFCEVKAVSGWSND